LNAGAAAPRELSTRRLLLRSIRESDEELYCGLFCDPETMRFIGPPWTRAEAAQAFRGVLDATRAMPPRALFLTMVPKDAQQPIGLCTLQNCDSARRRVEMGVMVASQVRARGLASEALVTVITHAFDTLPVDEVWVRIALDHAACERTAVIIGLVRHAETAPEDVVKNVSRWSAYRGSWRPSAAPDGVSVHYSAAND
jgi:RimJ/RimL family protein N-acetyltransferase